MAVYVTGDTHRDFSRFQDDAFPEQSQLSKDDFVIICGDFGVGDCADIHRGKRLTVFDIAGVSGRTSELDYVHNLFHLFFEGLIEEPLVGNRIVCQMNGVGCVLIY